MNYMSVHFFSLFKVETITDFPEIPMPCVISLRDVFAEIDRPRDSLFPNLTINCFSKTAQCVSKQGTRSGWQTDKVLVSEFKLGEGLRSGFLSKGLISGLLDSRRMED